MMQAIRNWLRRNGSDDFKPATKADFKPCCMAGVAPDGGPHLVPVMQEVGPRVAIKYRDRGQTGGTGAAGLFVRAMLLGRSLSIQQYVGLLKANGYVLNEPARAAREARNWLRHRYVTVSSREEVSHNGVKHRVWWVEPKVLASSAGTSAKATFNAKNQGREVR